MLYDEKSFKMEENMEIIKIRQDFHDPFHQGDTTKFPVVTFCSVSTFRLWWFDRNRLSHSHIAQNAIFCREMYSQCAVYQHGT